MRYSCIVCELRIRVWHYPYSSRSYPIHPEATLFVPQLPYSSRSYPIHRVVTLFFPVAIRIHRVATLFIPQLPYSSCTNLYHILHQDIQTSWYWLWFKFSISLKCCCLTQFDSMVFSYSYGMNTDSQHAKISFIKSGLCHIVDC